jgi:dihydroorotase
MSDRVLLAGGRVLDPTTGLDAHLDVLVADGRVERLLPPRGGAGATNPDLAGGPDGQGNAEASDARVGRAPDAAAGPAPDAAAGPAPVTAAGPAPDAAAGPAPDAAAGPVTNAGSSEVADAAAGAEVVDVTGYWVTPGFVDLHTHLREPGGEDAEDVATGSAAGAAGGYTALCAMANTSPVCDAVPIADMVWQRGREVGLVDVFPVGSITAGLAGRELTPFGELNASAARVDFFSDDGIPLADALVMRRALQYATAFDAVICNHAEDPDLTADAQMNEGAMSSVLGLAGWPHEAEEVMIARDLILAAGVGARLHVPHVTTAGAVELIRAAKARGVRVTAEVTPHHLLLTDDLVSSYDPVLKVNPPVRTDRDVAALREALVDGTLDAVATDHAPHAPELKDQEWEHAPCGMLGLETAFGVVNTALIRTGQLDPLTAVARFTTGPASVRDVEAHGGGRGAAGLVAGAPANLAVFDPEHTWTVTADQLHSRARNSPYIGRELTGRAVHTMLRGRFTLRDGVVREVPERDGSRRGAAGHGAFPGHRAFTGHGGTAAGRPVDTEVGA